MIDRYEILCYLGYNYNGPYAIGKESKDDDGKYVLFTDHQKQMTATETQAQIDSAKRQHEIDELKDKIERLEELAKPKRTPGYLATYEDEMSE